VSFDDLRERVSAIKHDLAKYVAWRTANFGDAAWEGPLVPEFAEALRADLLQTRGDEPAWVVWDRWIAELPESGDLPEPELSTVADAVDELRGLEAAVRSGGDELAAARARIRDAQGRIRVALRDLHRRLAAR
jgi:hypothetical protein